MYLLPLMRETKPSVRKTTGAGSDKLTPRNKILIMLPLSEVFFDPEQPNIARV